MNQHPARTMLSVWLLCVAAFSLLPYQLLERGLTIQGALVLATFIAAFLVGTLLLPARQSLRCHSHAIRIDASKAEAWMIVASILATVFFLLDAKDKSIFELAIAYELRSESADALLKADVSKSSIWFQLAFLLYPAGYLFAAVHVLYEPKVRIWKLAVFGFLPVVLATLIMGGRNPIFYALLVFLLAFRERKKLRHVDIPHGWLSKRRKWFVMFFWFVVVAALFLFFSAIFLTRAAVVGGSIEMFEVAELRWGVGFHGPVAEVIFSVFGADITYLFFIFVWYLIQGYVMANYLFTAYEGPLQMGVYGVDLMSALIRRLDPQRMAEGFDTLLTLGTYGFLPSAWGSLYVDFGYFALVFCVIWGAFAALCYRRIVVQHRKDWLLIGPFATIGIVLSLINTPIGFTNGFVTHLWLLFAFLLLKVTKDHMGAKHTTTLGYVS